MKASEILERALGLFGDGRNWRKAPYVGYDAPCARFAVMVAADGRDHPCRMSADYHTALHVLRRVLGVETVLSVEAWNDAPERTFADVKAAFCRAIEAAQADEARSAACLRAAVEASNPGLQEKAGVDLGATVKA